MSGGGTRDAPFYGEGTTPTTEGEKKSWEYCLARRELGTSLVSINRNSIVVERQCLSVIIPKFGRLGCNGKF